MGHVVLHTRNDDQTPAMAIQTHVHTRERLNAGDARQLFQDVAQFDEETDLIMWVQWGTGLLHVMVHCAETEIVMHPYVMRTSVERT